MTKKDWKEHAKTCNTCFWLLAVWRCPIGKAYLDANKITHINTWL